jgi:hypothetical protein
MSRTFRWIAIPAVLLVLTAGAAQAWPSMGIPEAIAAPEAESFLGAAWERLMSWFRSQEPPTPVPEGNPEKEGCGHDPWGRPLPCG